MTIIRFRDGRQTSAIPGFVADKRQRLQKSSQWLQLVIVFLITCTLAIVAYRELTVSVCSEELTHLETNYTTLEEKIETNYEAEEEKIENIEFSDCRDDKYAIGKVIWKFDNYETRIEKMKETNWYYSYPFYSSLFGYKMRLLCKVTKDCIHLSIEILKGRCDHMLKWPFKGKIALRILDQSQKPKNMLTMWIISPFDQRNADKVLFETECEFVTREELRSRKYITADTIHIAAIVEEVH